MKNQVLEDKIYGEILVDCYDQAEINMSWLQGLQDEMKFPFEAEINIGHHKMKSITVLDIADIEGSLDQVFDIRVKIELGEYLIEYPLSKLRNVKASEETELLVEAWQYWAKR